MGSTAVCVYSDNDDGYIHWYRWTSSGGWQYQSDIAVGGLGYIESVSLRRFAQKNEIMAVISDNGYEVYTATYDGTSWTLANPSPVTSSLSRRDSVPFSFSIQPP